MRQVYGVILSCCLLVAGGAVAQAAENPLGKFNFAAKIDSLNFIDSVIKESDAGTTTFFGLEGYGSVAPNLYLGGEIGYAHVKGSGFNIEFGAVNTEVLFVPVEVNLKRAVEVARNVTVDFGGGLSYNYVHYRAKARVPLFGLPPVGDTLIQDVPDWLLGGQFFADVNFTVGSVFIGLNGKFQVVAPGESVNYSGTTSYDDYSNWRAGGQIGMRF